MKKGIAFSTLALILIAACPSGGEETEVTPPIITLGIEKISGASINWKQPSDGR